MIGTTLQLDGAPLSQFELARGLAGSGLDVSVFVRHDGPLRERYRSVGLPVTVMPELSCSAAVPTWYETDIINLAARLQASGPDLILASTVDSFEAIDAARLAGIPSIWNIRESEPWRARLADRHIDVAARALAAFGYPAAVIFAAGAAMQAWRDFVPADRRHLIYNASALEPSASNDKSRSATRSRLRIAPDEYMIISVGTLSKRKSQIDIARAVATGPSTLRPVFVGGSELGYVEKVRRALGSALPRAIFTGIVEQVGELIAAADVLVCSSRFEAFPRTLLEAAAFRTPIVATALDGTKERLTDGVSALLYPPGDIAALSSHLERLLRDQEMARGLASCAHEQVTLRWTHADMIAAYADKIRRALV